MKKHLRRKIWLPLLAVILIGGYILWTLCRPLPPLKPSKSPGRLQFSTPTAQLTWPVTGESAVGIDGSGILDTHNAQKPLPTASTAKIITALTVLRDKPLALNQTGPTITLTANDVALYQSYAAQDGSVVPVVAGEQISEYQMLEAMLLPSANNMADSLAIWAYGSLPAYQTAATSYVKQLGLEDTTIGSDASGFSPTTTSTAHDLVKLGEAAMQNPVLTQIVSQSAAAGIPVAGTVKNVNSLLGTDGIIGIKTGNSDQDPGVFLSAARLSVNQKPVTIVTALLGSVSLWQAMHDSLSLVQTAEANFKPLTVLKAGGIVGSYRAPGGTVPVVASQNLGLTTWSSAQVSGSLNLPTLPTDSKRGRLVTTFTISDPVTGYQESVPLQLAGTPPKPTAWYRLLHP